MLEDSFACERSKCPMTEAGAASLDLVVNLGPTLTENEVNALARWTERLHFDPVSFAREDPKRASDRPSRLVASTELVGNSACK
jgi:hypothetical protein